MQSWQKCPVCNGKGYVAPTTALANATSETCSVCKGQKIINTSTGKPPEIGVLNLTSQKEHLIVPEWIEEHNRSLNKFNT